MPGKQEHNYQVLARRYRPSRFSEVIGQEAIITTLKNGIKFHRLAHAYLFAGSRGTGKTTIARLLAKAINCDALSEDLEPCNKCSSCLEIASGHSMDVIEIDGASNRGIDEIRQINETVGYATATGRYKVYIIDEVHMLTKEAFNALLKTLEEPPPRVKFLFATTEPHKVLPTILSRCQRFNLRRLSIESIVQKLQKIADDLKRIVDPEVLQMVASRAEGGLRDAESLFDQLLSFYEGNISVAEASSALGTLPQEVFFKIDQAGKEGNLAIAFEIAHDIFHEGKDLSFFIQMLTQHYRRLLVCKLAGHDSSALDAPNEIAKKLQKSSELYLKEQLLTILELCLEAENTLRQAPSPRIAFEGFLLKILRSHVNIPLDHLVGRLIDLEKRIRQEAVSPPEPVKQVEIPKEIKKEEPKTPPTPLANPSPRYDTIMQFAAVELEGKIIKK